MSQVYKHLDKYSTRAIKQGYPARSVYKLQEIDQRHHIFSTHTTPRQNILDLGCAPGSWMMYIAQHYLQPLGRSTHTRGTLVGIDKQPLSDDVKRKVGLIMPTTAVAGASASAVNANSNTYPSHGGSNDTQQHMRFIQDDIHSITECTGGAAAYTQRHNIPASYDIILSDIAASTTGHKQHDSDLSVALCTYILMELCVQQRMLKPGGTLLMKVFQGADYDALLALMKQYFPGRGGVKGIKPRSSMKSRVEMYLLGKSFKSSDHSVK